MKKYFNPVSSISMTFAICFAFLLACQPVHGYAQIIPDIVAVGKRADSSSAKTDSASIVTDSVKALKTARANLDTPILKHQHFSLTPKRTGLYSAILPGLGQFYNHQYWKIPVIYAGIGVSAYYFSYNLTNYNRYQKAYVNYPNDSYSKKYTQDQTKQIRDDFERYLDFTVLLGGLGYVIQVLDAIAAAHLKDFDISRDLSLKLRPVATTNGIGFGLVMNMKNKPSLYGKATY